MSFTFSKSHGRNYFYQFASSRSRFYLVIRLVYDLGMALVEAFHLTIERPTMLGFISVLIPLWVSFLAGVAIGWLWKPKLLGRSRKVRCLSKHPTSTLISPQPSHQRTPSSRLKAIASAPCLNSLNLLAQGSDIKLLDLRANKKPPLPPSISEEFSASRCKENPSLLTDDDFKKLRDLVEMKDGGPSWTYMLDRSTSTMTYEASRRDPQTGPPEYRTRTVFEDATPEMVRDFFWDDEFRPRWDSMLAYASTLDECMTTGNMVVHWIRKFPFFCSDREYIIGRRIWELNHTYYCVTKGVSAPIPRQDKPKRVDLYFSSWFIRAVESRKNEGQLTACEVLLFHYEDMGIPYEILKLGVRQGMWGAVKNIEPALRSYQKARLLGEPISRPAYMACINTKLCPEIVPMVKTVPKSLEKNEIIITNKPSLGKLRKVLIVGGIMVLTCTITGGLLSKAVLVGAAGKFADMKRKMGQNRYDRYRNN